MQALSVNRHLPVIFKAALFLAFLIFSQRSFAQTPTITSFAPISGDIGTTVTIVGTNFDATAANNIVFFGATRATVTLASATSLTIIIPAGATHARITVLNTTTGLTGYSKLYFRPMSSPKRAFTAVDLAAQIDLTTGVSPISTTIGDLDGDGLPDLVVANQTSNTVSIFHNTGSTGNIAFASKIDLPTGAGPRHIAIGDIDGDGFPDLAVAGNTNEVTILLNTSTVGTVSFASGVAVATVGAPQWVSFSDVDADGMSDLLVAGSNTVSVLRNTSSLGVVNLTPSANIAIGFQDYSVTTGDLDGDGLPDIAVGRNNAGITISRNTSLPGFPSFAPVQNFGAGAAGRTIIMADIDGDGNLDVIAAHQLTTTISVLRNISTLGNINFSTDVPIATGAQNFSVAAGDLDADGRIDLVVGRQAGGTMALLLNTGSAGTISFSPALTITTAGGIQTIAVGDLDSDGVPDIAMSRTTGNTLSVFRNKPVSPYITSFTPASSVEGGSITITGDHFNTVAGKNVVYFGATKATITAASATSITATVPVGSTHAAVTVLNSTTDLSAAARTNFSPLFSPVKGSILSDDFAARVAYSTGNNATWSAAGDLDGDGKADIAVTYADKVAVFLNTGNPGTIGMAAAVEFTANSTTRSVSIGDIDGDGKLDLAVTNYFSSDVSIFRNTSTPGNLSFVKTDIASGATPFHVIIADIDNDGKPDLTVTNETVNTISVLRNTGIAGNISYAPLVTFATGANPRVASVADLDGDGKADIATANMNSNNVTVLLNTSPSGSITFAPGVNFIVGSAPWAVTAGDLDGDGKADLAVANSGSDNMSALLNSSTVGVIGFGAKTDFPAGTAPSGIAIADIDADGKADVAVSAYSGFISAFHNQSTAGIAAFAPTVNYPAGAQAVNVVIADFDGDGRPDLESPNESANTLSILRNAPPALSAAGALIAVNTTYGTASAATSFSISGTDVVGGITITPPTGFEVSQTAGGASGYAGSGTAITVTGTGTITSKTIYVRLTANTAAGTYAGNIVSSSGSAIVNTATVISTVSPAVLTITPPNAVRTYQGPVLTGAAGSTTFTSTGLQNSETIGSVTIGYTAGAGNGNVVTDGAGTYTGTVIASAATGGTFSPANYTISYASGNLTVNAAPLTITAGNGTRIYGTANPAFAASFSGFVNGESEANLTTQPIFNTTATINSPAGTYPVTPSAASSPNYSITYADGLLTVLPTVNIAPSFAAIASQSLCYSPAQQSITISGITAGGENGQTVTLAVSSDVNLFSSISASPVINGTANINYVLRPGVSGTAQITVRATDDGGILNGGADTFSRTFTISVNALPVATISNDITISKGSTTTLTASGGNTYQWSNAAGIVGGQNTAVLTVRPLVTASYTVAVTNGSGCTVQQTITVTVADDYKALDPLNAITPNGDGKNDTWVIGNIDAYPNNTVKVYDRAGRPIYSKRGYNNDWDGTYNGSPLQQDTYYFIVDFGTGVKPIKGFVSIVR